MTSAPVCSEMRPRMKRLEGKVAIVTGAGSRGPGLGNGKATAILFAREGARVLCVDQAKDRADETVGARPSDEGGVADAFAADVTVAAQCRAMVDSAHRPVGRPRCPAQQRRRIESRHGPHDDHRRRMGSRHDRRSEVDAADLPGGRPGAPRRGAGGSIICVSSVAGLRGYGRTAYAAAKAGVIGFVKSVAVQLGPKRIRVNAIAPGTVWTPMVEDLGPEARERRRRASRPSAPRAPAGTWAGARSTWPATSRAG